MDMMAFHSVFHPDLLAGQTLCSMNYLIEDHAHVPPGYDGLAEGQQLAVDALRTDQGVLA